MPIYLSRPSSGGHPVVLTLVMCTTKADLLVSKSFLALLNDASLCVPGPDTQKKFNVILTLRGDITTMGVLLG